MRRILYAIAFLAGVFGGLGGVCAEEVLVGQMAYSRIDMITKKQDRGIWTFTMERETREIRITKLVVGSVFETETITFWTRVSVLHDIHLKESLAYPFMEMRPDRSNFGYMEASDPETNEVLYRWPMSCTMEDKVFFYQTLCTARMDGGGSYEVTRDFMPRQPMATLVERRKMIAKDGTVTSDVIDAMN
jgi:hypothetical protein